MSRFKKALSFNFIIVAVIVFTMIISALSTPVASGLMNTSEQVLITNLKFIDGPNGTNDAINATIANIGYASTTIMRGYVNGSATGVSPASEIIAKGTLKVITLTLEPDTLVDASQYQVNLLSNLGNHFVQTSTYNSTFNGEYDPLKDYTLQSQLQKAARSSNPNYKPDYSLGFTILFALVLFVILALAAKYKSFRGYTTILISIGFVEFVFLFSSCDMFSNLPFSMNGYAIFALPISLLTIVGGATLLLLNLIAPKLGEKKGKFLLILFGYLALILGGSGIYFGKWFFVALLLFMVGLYLSIIGTANYFLNRPK